MQTPQGKSPRRVSHCASHDQTERKARRQRPGLCCIWPARAGSHIGKQANKPAAPRSRGNTRRGGRDGRGRHRAPSSGHGRASKPALAPVPGQVEGLHLYREGDQMGRLAGRGLPPRLGRAPSRFGQAAAKDEQDRTRQRDASQPWRAWYKTARWQKLRQRVLKRDGYVCQQTGVMLVGKHPAPNSPVADHIAPHRGNPDLFWNEDNLQTVSKGWHDQEKQRIEKSGEV